MKIKRYDKSNKIEEEMGFEFDKLELIGHINMYFDVLIYKYNKILFFLKLMLMKFYQLSRYKITENTMAG